MTISPPGIPQRLRLAVPTGDVTVTLGERLRHASPSGAAINTTRNVWLEASGPPRTSEGDRDPSTLTFQSTGQAWFQSTGGPLYLVARNLAALAAQRNVYGYSQAGLTLIAGYMEKPEPVPRAQADGSPSEPNVLGVVNSSITDAHAAWYVVDSSYHTMSAAYGLIKFIRSWTDAGWRNKYLISLANTTKKMLISGYSWTHQPQGMLNVFGKAGVLMATPGFAQCYGMFGVHARAVDATAFGMLGASLTSVVSASVDSWNKVAVTSAMSSVAIEAFRKTTISANTGTMSATGTRVVIGSKTKRPKPTTEVNLDADLSIDVEGTLGPVSLGSIVDTKLSAAESASLKGTETLEIVVQQAYRVRISPAVVEIEPTLGVGATVKIDPTSIAISGPDPSQQLVLTPATISASLGPGRLQLSPAGVSIVGPRVEIG